MVRVLEIRFRFGYSDKAQSLRCVREDGLEMACCFEREAKVGAISFSRCARCGEVRWEVSGENEVR